MEPTSSDAPAALSPIALRPLDVILRGDERRVIARPFILGAQRIRSLFDRIATLSDSQVDTLLRQIEASYSHRHEDLHEIFDEHYTDGAALIGFTNHWTLRRKLLAGAYLTMEYAIESAALFNPSIVAHPDQSPTPEGGLRIVMSLRATGEGHVSSIVFRTGFIQPDGSVDLDPYPDKLHRSRISPDRAYLRSLFQRKLREMGVNGPVVENVLSRVAERFTQGQLVTAVEAARPQFTDRPDAAEIFRTILWLANSNYHIDLAADAELSELVIFPMSEEESRGIEDLRMVRFVDDDGTVTYFGTYTAYNGQRTLPMLMHTTDFRRIEFASLNGAAALNKGMALFPRRIDGRYVMCSRIDGENLFISTSESVHFWHSADKLAGPVHPWEFTQIGNCGSPIETESGWLLLTHGVGPMRTYAIGAMLLDLHDPRKIIGQLRDPLIAPQESEREGYVPNVVYTCGALVHRGTLYIPYANADRRTSMVCVELEELLDRLRTGA